MLCLQCRRKWILGKYIQLHLTFAVSWPATIFPSKWAIKRTSNSVFYQSINLLIVLLTGAVLGGIPSHGDTHVITSPLWPGYRPSEEKKKQPFTGSLKSPCCQECSAFPFYFKGVLVVVLTLETLPARTCIILPIWYRLSESGMINTQRLHCNSFIAICNPSTKLQKYCCCTEELKKKMLEMCVRKCVCFVHRDKNLQTWD